MLRILDRYLLRELAMYVLAITAVLLVVMAGGTFARVLQRVADGTYPATVMFRVLGLRMVPLLVGIFPLACFLGLLSAFGRLYHDSEMHVLASSGVGLRELLKPIVMLGLPIIIVVAVIALWLGPLAQRYSHQLVDQANRSVVATGLDAGRFSELPQGEGTMFVASMSRDGKQLEQVFLVRENQADGDDVESLKVITAERGELYYGDSESERYLALHDGWQFNINMGQDDWGRMQYVRNDVALSNVESSDESRGGIGSASPTLDLWHSDSHKAKAELAWRVAAPVTTLVLIILAIPLSRQAPRESRYGRIVIAIISYFIYFSLLSLARSLMGQGTLSNSLPIWSLHVLITVGSLLVLWKQYAPRKIRRRQA